MADAVPYIVGTGHKRLIINTSQGYRQLANLVEDTLDKHAIELSHVLVIHWHGDHTGGVSDLTRMCPPVSDRIYKNSPEPDQWPIERRDVFSVEGAAIRAVHSPGHSHDHMCFILEEENAMFTGDNVMGHGTSAVEELDVYVDMLEDLQSYQYADEPRGRVQR